MRISTWGALSALALCLACGSTGDNEDPSSAGGSGNVGAGGPGGGAGEPQPPAACGSLTEGQAREIATQNLDGALSRAITALEFVEASHSLGRLLSGGEDPTYEFVTSAQDSKDDLVADLSERLLASGNFESASGSEVVFKMNPDILCPASAEDVSAEPVSAAEDEQRCRDSLAEHDVRVRVSRVACEQGDNVLLALEVSSEPLVPLTAVLRENGLSLTLSVRDTLLAQERFGDLAEGATLDPDVAGELAFELSLSDTGVLDFGLGVLKSVVWGGTDETGERTRFTLDQAPNLLSIIADPTKQEIQGTLAMAAAGLAMHLADFADGVLDRSPVDGLAPSEQIDFAMPGLAGAFAYQASTDTFAVTGLGLRGAPALFKYGAAELLAIDWNTAAGRELDAAFTSSGSDLAVALGNAGLDLELEYALAPIADKLVEPHAFTLDDTLRLAFGGGTPAATFLQEAGTSDLAITGSQLGALLRVDAGLLDLTSRSSASENVSVPAAQCLLRDDTRAGEHAFLSLLYAGACP